MMAAGLASARTLSHPFSLSYALLVSARIHLLIGDIVAVEQFAEAAVAIATEQGYGLWLAHATVFRGAALVERSQFEPGITLIRDGLTRSRAAGADLGQTYFLVLLSDALIKAGLFESALTAVTEALALAEATAERYWEAELYRLNGLRVMLTASPAGAAESHVVAPDARRHLAPVVAREAESCFLKSLEIARRQQACALDLRASMSLAQLWQQQGRGVAARDLMVAVFGRMVEGFTTRDVREARALRRDLARSC